MNFKAGESYAATLFDCKLSETSAGLPQVTMQFVATSGDEKQTFFWHGSLKEGKAQEITVKSLLAAGFTGNDIEDLKKDPMPFKTVSNLQIVLELDNKDKLRVKWINAGGSVKQFKGAAPKLAGAFAKARQEMGIKATKQEEVPF